MPSTINADNGVSSGSAGLKSAADSSGVLQLQTNGTTAVTVDTSQNVGVGTASPGYKLDVRGVIAGGNGTIVGGISYSTRTEIGAISNHPVGFITNNTTQMLLDTSGNLGLGVTPSAWGSSWKAIEVGGKGSSLFSLSAGDNTYVTSNSFFNGTNWIYAYTSNATAYNMAGGVHKWLNAPSGTAGNAISFTQAMTLDASGNLLVGTTSASGARLNVNGDVQQRGTNGRITQAVKGIGSTVSSITVDVGGGLDGTSYFVEISLSGYNGVYLRYIHTVYKTNSWTDFTPNVVQNLASSGVSVAYSSPSAGVLRYTITASTTYPVVQVKVTSGGTTVDPATTISIS